MIGTFFEYILSIGAVILLFGGTVFIHELGHFLTAKWFKLRIDAFAIGMGPALWKKEVGGVMYKVCAFPIGGYVALPQMDITGSVFENEDAKYGRLERVDPWKRIIIAVAGPFMNVVGALLLCTIVWAVGKQPSEGFQEPVLATVYEKSPAYEQGLRPGDRIVEVNGDGVNFWADVDTAAVLNDSLDLKVVRDDEVVYVNDVPTREVLIGNRKIQILAGVIPLFPTEKGAYIYGIEQDEAAYKAGFRPGDIFTSINGEPVISQGQFREAVFENGGEEMNISVLRDGEELSFPITPYYNEEFGRWLIGIQLDGIYGDVHPSPFRQIQYFKGQIFRTLVAFTRAKERGKAADNIGSPILIFSGMHSFIKESVMNGLWFTAMININLAIMNLLPLIILDGGHVMIALFEIVTGKRPHRGLMVGTANVVIILLLSLMAFMMFRDTTFLISVNQEEEPAEATAVPTAPATEAGEGPSEVPPTP